ncbi:hypothetical protein BDL97_12G034400 [Sphagnum fallax]|nr:hypothetical protein BDL97_12G034400 [Sphagnum fallax]
MAGTGGGGYGSKGGDNNEERLRKMVADHLRASELFAIDIRRPEGKEKLDLKKKEEERKKLPLITLVEEGIPTELAYTRAKSTIRHIVSTNFARGVEWGTLSKAKQKIEINQLKATRHLKEIIEQLTKAKKARELGRFDRDLKALELKLVECQSVVDKVGDPPLKFLKAAERVKLVPPTTHKLGQGGIPNLKAAFITAAEMTMGQEHGKEHLCEHVDAVLASEGESESSQGSSDEEDRGASTAPSATTSSGPNSIASRNASSAGGKDKEDRKEDKDEEDKDEEDKDEEDKDEEEEEGQGDDDKREEDEQPPPPPENTRKKHSRKKSKRGRKSR